MFVYCQVLNNALACHNKWRNRMGTVLSCFLVRLFSSLSTPGLDGRLGGALPGRDIWLPDVEIMTDHWWDITGCGKVTCETAGHNECICNALIGFSQSSGSQKSIENDCRDCSNSAYLVLPSQKIPTSPPQWKGVCISVDVHSDSDALTHWGGYPMWQCMQSGLLVSGCHCAGFPLVLDASMIHVIHLHCTQSPQFHSNMAKHLGIYVSSSVNPSR